ncbi:MAG: hypothetical protein ACKVJX_01360 [Verrucomicrobiia bacterium]|jgi:uncharacterized protein YggT (Ycf19 family)
MDFIDFILNFCLLLLWLNWRTMGFARLRPSIATHSLMSGLKMTQPQSGINRWAYLVLLVALLALRSFFYNSVGPAVQWAPSMDFGPIGIAFRSDFMNRAALFSILSFGKFLAVFYVCLIVLSAVNVRLPEFDPIQSWVRMHLGAFERLPSAAKLFAPFVLGAATWAGLGAIFVTAEMAPPSQGAAQSIKEAAIIGLYAYFPLKYFLFVILGAHVVNSYVYLGNHEVLNFIDSTARNLTIPLKWLTFGRIDLAPIVGIVLVVAVNHFGQRGLEAAYGVRLVEDSMAPAAARSEESGPESGVDE